MFEVITRTQPDDYQSLEILKEAYTKLGRMEDTLRTARKLAEAYFNVGSYALAMQECEMLLGQDPNAPEVLAMLGDIESRLQAAGQTLGGGLKHGLIAKAVGGGEGGLVRLDRKELEQLQFARTRGRAAGEVFDHPADFPGRKRSTLHWKRCSNGTRTCRGRRWRLRCWWSCAGRTPTRSTRSSRSLIDRTKGAFIPLEYYDFDRQLAGCCRTISPWDGSVSHSI